MHGGPRRAGSYGEGRSNQQVRQTRSASERLAVDPDCSGDTCGAFLASECRRVAGPQVDQGLLFDFVRLC